MNGMPRETARRWEQGPRRVGDPGEDDRRHWSPNNITTPR